MKKLLLVTTGGIAAFALIFTMWNPFEASDHVAIYKPRSAKAHAQEGYDAHGAMQVQREMKKNYFTGQVEYEDLLNTRRALKRYADKKGRDNDMEWNSLGPDNIGGRTRAVWINPEDDNHLIGGGVSGGLWQTFNAGNNWEPIESFNKHEDFYQHMIIATIARTGSGIYYIGTGSQHEHVGWGGAGTAGFPGGGVWRSTDPSGTEWENVFSPSPFTTNSEWLTVDAIVVDPNDPEKLWIAHNRGLDVYYHGSEDLEERPEGLPQSALACEDVHISNDGEVILASIGNQGYMSTDGGESFSDFSGQTLANGGPNILGQGGNGRIEFAIAPSDPDYLYAAVVNNNNSLRGVLASFDRGTTWYRIAQDVSQNPQTPFQPFGGVGGQGVWDCAIVVNPTNPQQIFLGGLVIYSHTITGSTPAVANWEQRSIYSTNYVSPYAVHPDIHFFVWNSNNIFYAATDGGFFRSNNMATSPEPTFFPVNKGYITTQCYGIAHSNDERTVGATQDNGTLYQNQEGVSPNSGIELFGGDGFDCDISFIRPTLVFGTSQFGTILRSLGSTFGENISPTMSGSGDFTTNIRLIETENDPYSTRGTMWGVDTIYDFFVEELQEWENGNISLGYVPAGTWIQHNSSADQRELWTQLEENLYFYQQGIIADTTIVSSIDTVETNMEVELTDSVVTPIDTNFVFDCDTLNLPLDTTFVDTCTLFFEELFCVHIDTIVGYQDTVICVVSDTIIDYETEYFYDTTYTYITEEVFDEIIEYDTLNYFSDSLLLIDPVQSLFAVGHGLGQGVYVTRDALNTSIEPEYWNVADIADMINCLEWSPDRNHLYIGTTGGRLVRVSGFNKVYHEEDVDSLETQVLISSGAPISDIAVDYSQGVGGPDAEPASEMVVVTRQQYGTTDKVLISMNAASTTSSNSFSSIWNIEAPLNRMPVYSCVIAKSDPNVIVIGTEVGIFRTNDGGDTWVEENGGMMDRVPVTDLRQQYREAWEVTNSEIIYAGTHGRGIFNNDDFWQENTNVDDSPSITDLAALSNMTIYPNPVNTSGWVEFKLNNPEDVRISIFSIKGQMVEQINHDNMPQGEHQVKFDVTKMSAGTYILVLEAAGEMKSGRFIVTK